MNHSYNLFHGLGPPAPPASKRSMLSSAAIHVITLAVLLSLGSHAALPELARHREHTYIALEPPPVQRPKPVQRILKEPAQLAAPMKARVSPPKLYAPPTPVPAQKPAIMPAPPKILAEAKPPSTDLTFSPPKPVPEPIKTGLFQPAATINANPKLTVESGNFMGPVITREGISDHQIIATGGFGGSQSADRSGGGGAVQSAGFGQTAAARPARPSQTAAASGGFAAPVVAEAHRAATAPDEAAHSVATILDKPRPAYTEEARALKIEGEVLVEMLFSADGKARVLRVIKGLGHGLDESAEKAAEGIRFRPATRGGTPVDSVAVAHIEFQLAY